MTLFTKDREPIRMLRNVMFPPYPVATSSMTNIPANGNAIRALCFPDIYQVPRLFCSTIKTVWVLALSSQPHLITEYMHQNDGNHRQGCDPSLYSKADVVSISDSPRLLKVTNGKAPNGSGDVEPRGNLSRRLWEGVQ